MDEKLDEFHRLVADGRYREARGILEVEPDISPQVAEKWLLWLDELHHDEWVQAGVASDLKKRDPQRALGEMGKMIGGTLALIPAGVALWLLVKQVMTFETTSRTGAVFFLLVSLILGYLGWQWVTSVVVPERSFFVGAGITGGLLVYLLTSRFPMWFFYDPPLTYLLAAFALLAPAAGYAAFRVGAGLGLGVTRLLRRE
jgi:hypothetical protein